MSEFKLYCDMDGVLVDFDKGYKKLTGNDLNGEHRTDTDFWDPINKAGYDFWINLEWSIDGKRLWSYIEKYKPELLATSEQIGKEAGAWSFPEKSIN